MESLYMAVRYKDNQVLNIYSFAYLIFKNVQECCDDLNVKRPNIYNCCNGKQRSCRGYGLRYE